MYFNCACRDGQGPCNDCVKALMKNEPPDQLITEHSVPGILDFTGTKSSQDKRCTKRPGNTSVKTHKMNSPSNSPKKKQSKTSAPTETVVRKPATSFECEDVYPPLCETNSVQMEANKPLGQSLLDSADISPDSECLEMLPGQNGNSGTECLEMLLGQNGNSGTECLEMLLGQNGNSDTECLEMLPCQKGNSDTECLEMLPGQNGNSDTECLEMLLGQNGNSDTECLEMLPCQKGNSDTDCLEILPGQNGNSDTECLEMLPGQNGNSDTECLEMLPGQKGNSDTECLEMLPGQNGNSDTECLEMLPGQNGNSDTECLEMLPGQNGNSDTECLEMLPCQNGNSDTECLEMFPEGPECYEEATTMIVISDSDDSLQRFPEIPILNQNYSLSPEQNASSDEDNTEPVTGNATAAESPLVFRSRWPFSDPSRTEGWPAVTAASRVLNPNKELVCDSVPQLCNENATFLVDVCKLRKPSDIAGDDNGAYERPTRVKQKLKVRNNKVEMAKENERYDYVLKKRYYKHKGTPTFRRMVYELLDSDGKQHKYSLLQYFFTDNVLKKLKYTEHGNSKTAGVFMPRTKETKERIKELSKRLPPAKVVAEIQREEGGAENLTSLSQTARNAEQVKNLKRRVPGAHRSRSGPSKETDFSNMFKLSQKADYVKSFELKGEHPRAFCATDQQLHDLQRNCCGPDASVLQIDGTFSLGNFYLTSTVYRSKWFENAKNHKSALMPGPCIIHARRSEEDYEYLARHISEGIKHKTVVICGSDGEKAIHNGFRRAQCFKNSSWLVCMLHARGNCKQKLEELGVKSDTKAKILKEIYGSEFECRGVRTRHEGLVDLETEGEFEAELQRTSWDMLETKDTGKPPRFKEWFVRYKSSECKETMLPPLRRLAGLGNPPRQFTTNDVESENMNIKREVDWQKKTWDSASNHLYARILAHYEELCRAVYKEGRYRLAENFQHLAKEPHEWNAMDVNNRRRHLEKAHLKPPSGKGSLSILAEESGIQGFSIGDLKSVWEGAEEILFCRENIVLHPGNSATTVVFDGDEVYTVCKGGSQFSCDSRCAKYKHFDCLFCQHTVAVAEESGELVKFLGWINSTIATTSMAMLNTAVNRSCRGAGLKKTTRKGGNNQLASDIDVLNRGQFRSGPEVGVPETTALLPMGHAPACATDRMSLPPLTALQLSIQEHQPFSLTFRHGLIQRCQGCRREFSERSKCPPHDLILKKHDFKEFPAREGLWKRSNTLVNTYYHLNLGCLRKNFPLTEAKDIVFYEDIKTSLTPGHINLLCRLGFHQACNH